jgi:hypothetical protein
MQPVRNHTFGEFAGHGTIHIALAAKVIEAHGGRFQCEDQTIRVWLPLSE